jgi:hypothetical protein
MIEIIKRLKLLDILLIVAGVACYFGWAFSKTDYYKKNFTPEFRNPNALLKIIQEIPSGNDNPEGSKEIQIGSRKFIIPNNIINQHGVKNERQDHMGIIVLWPTMESVTNKFSSRDDVVNIQLEARKEIPHSASRAQLEREISGRPSRVPESKLLSFLPSKGCIRCVG